jgi:hypothetical protein
MTTTNTFIKLVQIAGGNESPCDCLRDTFKQRIEVARKLLDNPTEQEAQMLYEALHFLNEQIKTALSL